MNWEEAKEIRKTYPRYLTKKHIQEIFKKWGVLDKSFKTERSDMFHFACSPRKDGKMNMSEFKMWYMFNNLIHEHEIKSFNEEEDRPALQHSHGMIISAWLTEIIGDGEYEPITQNFRKRMLRQLLQTWKKVSSYFSAQVKGVQTVLDIKTKVRSDIIERYPNAKKHFNSKSFEHQCWEIVRKFINENSL